MKLLLTFVLCIFFSKNYSQNKDIRYVHFSNKISSSINSNTDIYISKTDKKIEVYVVKYNYEKHYKITDEKFLELTDVVSKIDPKDVIQDVQQCLDGYNTEIEFSTEYAIPQNSVNYTVSCLDPQNNAPERKDYIKAISLILEIAKFKFSDIF